MINEVPKESSVKNAKEFFRDLSGEAFVVQFVFRLEVEGSESTATQLSSYLISAGSDHHAREIAANLVPTLSDSYRNSAGSVVKVTCVGIHTVEQLDYSDDDRTLELGVFQFSDLTTPELLIDESSHRTDLPLLN